MSEIQPIGVSGEGLVFGGSAGFEGGGARQMITPMSLFVCTDFFHSPLSFLVIGASRPLSELENATGSDWIKCMKFPSSGVSSMAR